MKLFILLEDGKPVNHPILESNFLENLSHLEPHQYAEFIRRPQPSLGVFEVYEGVRYDWVGNVIEDIHIVRTMTEEEKNQKREEAIEFWKDINGPLSWIFNPETCGHEPPIPYPSDGKHYRWVEEQLNWEEVNIE
jgi:hypothetical protein